ncbi:TRAP transporter small permease [Vibrio splendidus]|jgi:TRAP-type C4-dicarboxylate transport system permease small subunit|uniref:TRAP transporter small permease protein n=6 Tax=Vibrio TaxID=662 RepID=A0A0P6ZCM2_VIBSP|nr:MULTISPECIES: TRAP transporter small permease [Vibrio]OED74314.1 C4-dicarboxylate ABC transporter substrate-binding protein [Vibrio splendidus ZS-139]HAH02827.1 TRAP transporter small permease [Vibrio sp.]KPM00972.1 C4-dicarboxylate ABC transporter substrate-binding protein [Vibrio splendidus]MBE8565149.1 TRAP transporter small permease [Vibrio sp. OPT20]MCC4816590.1 TRAP transporter small permease [Vibrio lentus]|tara:strand:- start:490 stop:978 length:489 start_codon:yes stop_codon:yes gene_type:complete
MQSVLKSIWKSIDVIMAVILTCMVALVFTNVVLRYGFSSGLRPSVELSRLGLVWVVMLGAAVVLRRGEHLAVAEFSERLFPKAVPVLRRICWVIVLISVGMLYVGSYRQMMSNWSDISQLTGLPSALFYLAGVVSGLLMGVIAFMRIFKPDWQLDSLDEEKE